MGTIRNVPCNICGEVCMTTDIPLNESHKNYAHTQCVKDNPRPEPPAPKKSPMLENIEKLEAGAKDEDMKMLISIIKDMAEGKH